MPTFSMENNNHEKTIGKISLKHYEHGIFIIFEEKSLIFSPYELKNVSEISVHSNEINMTEIFNTNLHGKIVYPDSMFNFSLLDNELIIKGDKNTYHDTTLIWANLIDVPKPKIGTLIGKAYQTSGQAYGSLQNPYSSFGNILGAKNSSRYPNYFRVDISLASKMELFGIDSELKFQIINLTNHYNVLLYNWDHQSSPSKVQAYSMFPRIITFGWEFEL